MHTTKNRGVSIPATRTLAVHTARPCASSLPASTCVRGKYAVSRAVRHSLWRHPDLQPVWSVSVAAPWRQVLSGAWWTPTKMAGLTPGRAGEGRPLGTGARVHSPGFVCQSLSVRENRDLEVGV